MIGWLLAGLAGAAILGSDSTSKSDGLITTDDKRCSLCGSRDAAWAVVEEWKNFSHSYVKVRFTCKECGRSWTKTYEIT